MATSKQKNPLLLPRIHNHILRHTFATRLNEANLNAKAIQAILGHKDIQTTMDIYTDATDILLEEAINTFQIHFKESLPPNIVKRSRNIEINILSI